MLVFCHPSSNFVSHYALAPTAALGVDAVGAVTRYAGNDAQVILENCVADLGSIISVRWSGFWSGLLWSGSGASIDPKRFGTFLNSPQRLRRNLRIPCLS